MINCHVADDVITNPPQPPPQNVLDMQPIVQALREIGDDVIASNGRASNRIADGTTYYSYLKFDDAMIQNVKAKARYWQHLEGKICFTQSQIKDKYLDTRTIPQPTLADPAATIMNTILCCFVAHHYHVITLSGYYINLTPRDQNTHEDFKKRAPVPPTTKNIVTMIRWYIDFVIVAFFVWNLRRSIQRIRSKMW